MAFEHRQYAFDYDGPGTPTAVSCLRVIAHLIGKNPCAWPAYAFIGKTIRKDARTALRGCQELADYGTIVIESGRERGGVNRFYIPIPEKYHAKFIARFGVDLAIQDVNMLSTPWTLVSHPPKPDEDGVGHECHTEVGQNGAGDGQKTAGGCDIDVTQEELEINQEPMGKFSPDARDIPPENAYLPPVDSTLFKNMFLKACYDAGASFERCLRFYERQAARNWPIMKGRTLDKAVKSLVYGWKTAYPKEYALELLRRDAARHPDPASPETPKLNGFE